MKSIIRFLTFGWLQARSCIFPAVIFITLAISKYVTIPFLSRYDFILLVCVLAQLLMILFKLETWDELKVICMFHVIGLMLELYKVHMLMELPGRRLEQDRRSSSVQWVYVC